jgi:hypothetical protein
MVSDWLFDLQTISNGAKNIPALNDQSVLDAFAAAGTVYDHVLKCGPKRLSIVSGYVSPSNPYFNKDNDWRESDITFDVIPPASISAEVLAQLCVQLPEGADCEPLGKTGMVRYYVDVDKVLSSPDWDK